MNDECKCAEIMLADETRHFRGCPLREKHPLGPTDKLVERANELRKKVMARLRADRAYYKKNGEMYDVWQAAKATALAVRGTTGELEALRAWLAIDVEWNNMKRVDRGEDEKWHDAMMEAWKALAADVGLHLSMPQDGEEESDG